MGDLPVFIDTAESCWAAGARQDAAGAVKVREDLARYEEIIAATRPQLVIETGTWQGMSARWFADHGLDVITIDRDQHRISIPPDPRIWTICGDSADAATVGVVTQLIEGRRTMVVLDSDHHTDHVAREILWYGPMVSAGCYLVVEDGIVRWSESRRDGPLEAVEEILAGDPAWIRDEKLERMFPVSMSPGGWWRRA